jgi:hypothetical protein
MIILFGIAAAIIGGLFWADRRRYYRHTYGSVIVSSDPKAWTRFEEKVSSNIKTTARAVAVAT